jgi:drug/metabolite transporter (DMT)-like permease
MFAMHIITVGKYTVKVDSIAMAVIQIAMVGILSSFGTFIAGEATLIPRGFDVWFSIFILAALATSGAFIVQNAMQKFTSPTHTALIYAGEPVFAALFAFLMLGEILSPQGILGSILILSGMLISELDWKALFKTYKKGAVGK